MTIIMILNLYIIIFGHHQNYIFTILFVKTNKITNIHHPILTIQTADLYCVSTFIFTSNKLLILITVSKYENYP